MKIIDDQNCDQMCRRLYEKAKGRGITRSKMRSHLKEMFGVDTSTDLEFEDYRGALAWLNTLPLIQPFAVAPVEQKKRKKKFLVKRSVPVSIPQ